MLFVHVVDANFAILSLHIQANHVPFWITENLGMNEGRMGHIHEVFYTIRNILMKAIHQADCSPAFLCIV